MRVQGWIEPLVVAGCCDTSLLVAGKVYPDSAETKKTAPPTDRGRLELLASIRQRIKSGFYNSDAVIDDIGHGFAQALDSAV